jgi:hypothetical protein
MRPVARVRWHTGLRSPAGLGDAQAAALRGRFEQLLRGSGDGVPGASPTWPSHELPSPSAGRSAGLEAGAAESQALTQTASVEPQTSHRTQDKTTETVLPTTALKDRLPPRDVACTAQPTTAVDANPIATAQPRAEPPSMQAAMVPLSLSGSPMPPSLPSTPQAAGPSLNAAASERATRATTSRATDVAEPAAVLPQPPPAPTVRADVQPPWQQPAPRPQAARNERDGLRELVRDLVQAVVQLSRGREGQWCLTMALKPQVLEGALVALDAQPGRLCVRFACDGADARARLAAVRDDLRLRLVEALSAARPVEVSVEVQQPTPAVTPSHV